VSDILCDWFFGPQTMTPFLEERGSNSTAQDKHTHKNTQGKEATHFGVANEALAMARGKSLPLNERIGQRSGAFPHPFFWGGGA
jgi:hypothetical protein